MEVKGEEKKKEKQSRNTLKIKLVLLCLFKIGLAQGLRNCYESTIQYIIQEIKLAFMVGPL